MIISHVKMNKENEIRMSSPFTRHKFENNDTTIL